MMSVQMPTPAEMMDRAVPFRVPLRTRFRGVTFREGVLLFGPNGVGEFAPFDDYSVSGAARWLAAAVDAAWVGLPPAQRSSVRVNAIIPDVDVDATRELTQQALQSGCTIMKVKVGAEPAVNVNKEHAFLTDLQRVAVVRQVMDATLGTGLGAIRLDVNGMWSVAEAVRAVPAFLEAAGGLEFIEQPCGSLSDCAEVRARTGVPIAIDEGLRRSDALDKEAIALVRDAADVVILKPIPLGGVARTLRLAEQLQRPVVISGSLDTSIGLAYVVATACALPQEPLACGLGTGALLAGDVTTHTMLPTQGLMHATSMTVDDQALAKHKISHDDPRHLWWLNRLQEAAALLAQIGTVAP